MTFAVDALASDDAHAEEDEGEGWHVGLVSKALVQANLDLEGKGEAGDSGAGVRVFYCGPPGLMIHIETVVQEIGLQPQHCHGFE